jgi:hypothetical protein
MFPDVLSNVSYPHPPPLFTRATGQRFLSTCTSVNDNSSNHNGIPYSCLSELESFCRAPFYVVHNILTAAIMHLLSATSSETTLRQQSITRFRVCVTALEDLQHTWPRAQKSINLLQELANRWNVVFALPMRLSNVLPVSFSVADSGKMAEGEARPEMPINNDFETAQMVEHHQAENYNGIPALASEEMVSPEEMNYNDIWMNPSTFNDFAIPDDPFENIGLDWLFAHCS